MYILLQILFGWFLADLVSGIVHFSFDNAERFKDWLVIGELYHDSQEHHRNPRQITEWTTWQTTFKPLLTSLFFLPLAYWFPWIIITFIIGSILSTRTHVWAHREKNNWFITLLQKSRLIISKEQHDDHHKNPFNRSYSVLNGWSNPFLNFIFKRLGI